MHYCWLKLVMSGQSKGMKFYLTSLGTDQIILEYPFLWEFNPRIDWKRGEILDGQLIIAMLIKENASKPKGFRIHKVSMTQKWAHMQYAQAGPEKTAKLPEQFRAYINIFDEKHMECFPPEQQEDL